MTELSCRSIVQTRTGAVRLALGNQEVYKYGCDGPLEQGAKYIVERHIANV